MIKHQTVLSVANAQLSVSSSQNIDELKMKFADVFQDGLGLFTKMNAKIVTRSDAKPVYRPKTTSAICCSR